MKQLTRIELKHMSKNHESCKFFDTADNHFFAIEIEDDLFRSFAYDILMNMMKSGCTDPEYSEWYLKLIYAHHGLKRSAVIATIEDENGKTTTSVEFNPADFKGDIAAEILSEEIRMGEMDHDSFEVFPPVILLDDTGKLLKNTLEHIGADLFELPTVLIDGDQLPESVRDEILKKNNGIINITKSLKPELWNLRELYESTAENWKEEL